MASDERTHGALRPAFRSYETVDPAAPEGDTLNLAWTRDERECLAVDLEAVLAAELRGEADDKLPFLNRYLVRDPYGEETLGPVVAAAFGLQARAGHVTCGAGVVSLLHAFARLAPAVRILGDTYPDFPYYITQNGGSCSSEHAPVWFLERPSLIGDAFADLGELRTLCDEAARRHAIVVIDESNANYYSPAWSAVGLAIAHDNLAVVRGFSKAYGLGGLRLAYCVASGALTERIRAVVPPLLASSLSLRLGARVLALGDITAPLRARIAAHKREVIALLERAGVGSSERAGAETLVASSEHLPYVFSRANPEELAARGIVGKHHPFWSGAAGTLASLFRLSVPLTDARMTRFRELLS